MEKLTEFIRPFRIGSDTKKSLEKMAQQDKRKLNDLIRLKLEEAVEMFNKKKL